MLTQMWQSAQMAYHEASSAVTWSSVVGYSAILAATWLSYKAFIEPFLSPLRKMPGTKFNPFWGNMKELLKGEAMEATVNMLKAHGPVMRYYFMFGRERVLLGDPMAIKHVTVTNCKNYIKPPSRLKLMGKVLGNGLVMSEGATHAAHKRLMSPAFNNTSIRKMVAVFQKRVKTMADHWTKAYDEAGKPVEVLIHQDVSKTTLDVIGEIAFDYDFKSFENEQPSAQAFQRILTGAGFSWKFAIPYVEKLPLQEVQNFKKDIRLMNKTVMDILNKKKADLSNGATSDSLNLVEKLLLARDEDGSEMAADEIRGEVMTIMLAGHETTSVGMSWCLLMMATHPEIQEKARQEIRKVLPPNGDDITLDDIEKLEYVNCIIKEILRLYPPVPMTLRQALKDDVIKGTNTPAYFIPEGTILLLAMGPMMRLPELFERPEDFWPERFHNPDVDANMYSYLPFLVGPRMCLGYKFALVEMKVMLSMLLRDLTFELIPGQKYRRVNRITMRPQPSLKLKVSRVDN